MTQGASAPVQGAPTATFKGLSPARLLETRAGFVTVDTQFQGVGQLDAHEVLELPVLGRGGIPASGVGSVALNVTAINGTAVSYLTVWKTGTTQPTASNLNFVPGRTTPNMVIVPVGADGKISIFNDAGSVDLIVDVLGYFPTGGGYTGLTPARFLDTRPNGTTVDDAWARSLVIGSGTDTEVKIAGRGEVPATGAEAVALNITVVSPTRLSYMTVWPSGLPQPVASTLNYRPGDVLANMAIVPIGANGMIEMWNATGVVYGIADVLGYFPTGSSYTGMTPARLMDTRPFGPTTDLLFSGKGKLNGGTATNLKVTGRGGVPATGVGSVVLNVTITNPSTDSYLTVWPTGVFQPNASNANFFAGQTVANMVIVPVGTDGNVSFFNAAGRTDAIVDVLGWFPVE